ncbi:MAG: ABC transporter, partial [Rhodanobacter sp.]
MRNVFRRLDGWLFAVLLVLAIAALGYVTTRYAKQADWTASGRTSLSAESRAVLAQLQGPLEIVSYANPQGDLRQ